MTMVALGIWQLGRADEKAALIARYDAALAADAEVDFLRNTGDLDDILFRRATLDCKVVSQIKARAGVSADGAKGWSHYATCDVGADAAVDLVIGWSRELVAPEWSGGVVAGVIAPGPRLVATTPQAGLEQAAPPDPADLPNNHLAYAGQWFFFALTALVIYWLAVRNRIKGQD
ncbi:MAG: SURF1 family protein [Sphingomonadales bacterium]|nr:MAG: SURF1 family protein [Sphingomonadales bacterium]